MAKDEAWGGEAISHMSQQELKIVTRSPNHGKWCLLQIASFFCHPATPARAGAAEVAGQSLPARCDAMQGLLPDSEHGFWGTTDLHSAQAARGGSQATGFLSCSRGALHCICREVQISVAGLWPEQRLVLWPRWVESEFIFLQNLAARGGKQQATSFPKTTQSALKKTSFNRAWKTNLPPASAAACQWCCLQESHRGGTAVTGGVAVATSLAALAQKWFGTWINTVGAAESGALPSPCLKEPPAFLLTPIKLLPYGRGAQPCTVCQWLNWSVGFDLI